MIHKFMCLIGFNLLYQKMEANGLVLIFGLSGRKLISADFIIEGWME